MKLTNLEIKLQKWGENEGKYLGKIEYEDKTGNVALLLDDRVSEAVLMCIGDTITQFAATAAENVKKSIIQSIEEAKQPKALTV